MNRNCSHGHFFLGMGMGMVIGSILGMNMSPSRREIKKVAHKAAKSVNDAVEHLTEAMGM
jgi:gas vesicle protein